MARAKGKEARRERRRRFGVPIAVRMALVTAVLGGAVMLAFSIAIVPLVRDAVRTQLRLAAHDAAFVAAAAPLDAWNEFFGTSWQGQSPEQVSELAKAMTREQREQGPRSPETNAARDWNTGRLVRLTEKRTRLEAAEVSLGTGEQRRIIASYAGESNTMSFQRRPDQEPLALNEGDADEGTLRLTGRDIDVIRGSAPIKDKDGAVLGEFAVYLNTGAVDDAISDLVRRMVVVAMIAVAASAAVAWLVARTLMRPVSLLQDDVRIVAGGDLAHRTQVRSHDEIGDLARTFDEMTQQLAVAAQAERDTAASRHQMSLAAEVAASLFPSRLPAIPGYDAAGQHETTGSLAGEYYDVLEMPGGKRGFLVASASGTGVPAAMVMTMARSFIAALAGRESDPGTILRDANALLSPDLRRGMYVTVLLAVLEPQTGNLTLANAGHAPLIVVRGGKLTAVHSEGIAMGLDKGPVFDSTLKIIRVQLQPGDRAVFYTPGLPRVNGADGSELGEERFIALVKREAAHPAQAFVTRMAAIIAKFRGEAAPAGGVTLLTLGRLGGGGSS
jgi:serine phosphatase RsbU (regulator of sigma subunit)